MGKLLHGSAKTTYAIRAELQRSKAPIMRLARLYEIRTILTDNGVQGWIGRIFGRVCERNGIEHRLTKSYHPWTNGQAERRVCTIRTIETRRSNPSTTR